ncbi:MAG: sigma-E factor negative regulatory protein [Alcaligenaceae bacterium]|nr:sigma-E factor negative regulatory protein [Alcaligenaceae bacterium]
MNSTFSKTSESQSLDWDESISALIDGEETRFDPENLDNPYGRQVWDTYHLIGDVLRSEELAIKPSDLFYARVSKAIDAEPVLHSQKQYLTVRKGLSGLAVAAAVASVVWVVQPFSSTPETAEPVTLVSAQSAQNASVNRDYHEYVSAHSQMVGTRPVRHVSYEFGVNR